MRKETVKKILVRVIVGILIVGGLLSLIVYYAFFDMNSLPKGRLIAELKSPSGTYTVKAYVSDQIPLTADAVLGELNFNMENRKPKNIYWNYREHTANIEWVDDNTVVINGHKLNVPREVFDFRR